MGNGIHVTQSDVRHELQSRSDTCLMKSDRLIPKDIRSSSVPHKHKNGYSKLTKNDIDFLHNNNNNNNICKNKKPKNGLKSCPFGEEPHSSGTSSESLEGSSFLHLKGEMKFVSTWKKVIFVCSPV